MLFLQLFLSTFFSQHNTVISVNKGCKKESQKTHKTTILIHKITNYYEAGNNK